MSRQPARFIVGSNPTKIERSRQGGRSWRCNSATRPRTSPPQTTAGQIDFHAYLGNGWGVLFSHPGRLHPGLHHRARRGGQTGARVRQAQHQGCRGQRRSARQAPAVARRYRGCHRRPPGLPIHRRSRPRRSHLYGMIHPNASATADGPLGLCHRSGQEGEADADLPGLDRARFRRDSAGARFAAADRRLPGRHARPTGGRATM